MSWLIDPSEKAILVYRPQQQTLVFDLPTQQLPVPLFANTLQLTTEEIFNWLLE